MTLVSITKAWLLERCTQRGKHLLWKLANMQGGPRGHYRTEDGKQRQFSVRNAAYRLWTGEDVPDGMVAAPVCNDRECLAKDCLKPRPHGGYNKGRRRSQQTREKMSLSMRAKCGHAPHLVALIKESDRPAKQLAEETGIGICQVYDIRNGRRWRDYSGSMGMVVASLLGRA